jgi:hypothetical protein
MLYSCVASPRSFKPERPYCSVARATDHVHSYYRYISQWRHARSLEGEFTLWRHLFPAIHPMFQRNQRRYHVKRFSYSIISRFSLFVGSRGLYLLCKLRYRNSPRPMLIPSPSLPWRWHLQHRTNNIVFRCFLYNAPRIQQCQCDVFIFLFLGKWPTWRTIVTMYIF